MSKTQERIVAIEVRIATLLSGLDAANERDVKIVELLLGAAEYTAMADDVSAGGAALGHLLAGDAIEMASGENAFLLGISLGNDACGLIALPPLHIGHHDGACISPDPSSMFPDQDASRPIAKEQPADKRPETKQPTAATTTGGASRQINQFFQPTTSDPDAAVQELSNELLTRAERLLEQAQSLKCEPPAAPKLTCSTADYR